VHLKTGAVQTEPPQEVLAELANDDDFEAEQIEEGKEQGDNEDKEVELDEALEAEAEDYFPSGSRPASSSSRPASGSAPPRFRRIVLGAGNVMPLRIQQRFSDSPSEPVLELRLGANGRPASPLAAPGAPPMPLVPPELEPVAAVLQPGELSEVVGTDAGMQILLRVS
jgi:hypothetical protein